MRLYVSSFRLGNRPEVLLSLLADNKRTAVIANAVYMKPADKRAMSVEFEIAKLKELGLAAEELDLRQYFGKLDELRTAIKQFGFIWARGGSAARA